MVNLNNRWDWSAGDGSHDDLPSAEELHQTVQQLNVELFQQLDHYFNGESIPEVVYEYDGFSYKVTFLGREIWMSEMDDDLRGKKNKPSIDKFLRVTITIIAEGVGIINLNK